MIRTVHLPYSQNIFWTLSINKTPTARYQSSKVYRCLSTFTYLQAIAFLINSCIPQKVVAHCQKFAWYDLLAMAYMHLDWYLVSFLYIFSFANYCIHLNGMILKFCKMLFKKDIYFYQFCSLVMRKSIHGIHNLSASLFCDGWSICFTEFMFSLQPRASIQS